MEKVRETIANVVDRLEFDKNVKTIRSDNFKGVIIEGACFCQTRFYWKIENGKLTLCCTYDGVITIQRIIEIDIDECCKQLVKVIKEYKDERSAVDRFAGTCENLIKENKS